MQTDAVCLSSLEKNPEKSCDNHHCKAPVFCFWKETKWLLRKEDGHLSRTILICKIANCVIEWLRLRSKIYTVRTSGNNQVTLWILSPTTGTGAVFSLRDSSKKKPRIWDQILNFSFVRGFSMIFWLIFSLQTSYWVSTLWPLWDFAHLSPKCNNIQFHYKL